MEVNCSNTVTTFNGGSNTIYHYDVMSGRYDMQGFWFWSRTNQEQEQEAING